jgi:hypothetical protein
VGRAAAINKKELPPRFTYIGRYEVWWDDRYIDPFHFHVQRADIPSKVGKLFTDYDKACDYAERLEKQSYWRLK